MSKQIKYKGRTQTLSQWSRETGLAISTIRSRLAKGWDIERALSASPKEINQANRIAHGQGGKIGPARELKNNFVKVLMKALNTMPEQEMIEIIHDQIRKDPTKFYSQVILPIVPKDDLEDRNHDSTTGKETAQIYISYNGAELGNTATPHAVVTEAIETTEAS